LLSRVEAAVAFSRRFADARFIPTGGLGRFGPSEASVMAMLLAARGVPSEHIMLEESGTDTLSSVRAIAAMLRQSGITAPLFVASSLYHLPRCVILLRLMGFTAGPAIPPVVSAGSRWWRRCYWWLREVPALPYDVVLALLWRVRGRG
jgi:uncharacterized SAM-binding protein YcdF (DUF218 family)